MTQRARRGIWGEKDSNHASAGSARVNGTRARGENATSIRVSSEQLGQLITLSAEAAVRNVPQAVGQKLIEGLSAIFVLSAVEWWVTQSMRPLAWRKVHGAGASESLPWGDPDNDAQIRTLLANEPSTSGLIGRVRRHERNWSELQLVIELPNKGPQRPGAGLLRALRRPEPITTADGRCVLAIIAAMVPRIHAPDPLSHADLADINEPYRSTLDLLLSGLTEREIARTLNRSPHTVHSHVTKLYKRLGVTNRAQLSLRLLGRSVPTRGS